MYGRSVDDKVLDFGHEGVLYRRSFIMYDKQTNSLWLHVTGEALKGELKGKKLEFEPSEVVPWSEWRRDHPFTKVLLGQRASRFMGSFTLKDKIGAFGLSLGQGREVAFYRYKDLMRSPVWNSEFQEQPVVVVFDSAAVRSAAFSAVVEKRKLHFQAIASPIAMAEPAADEIEPAVQDDQPSAALRKKASPLKMRDKETGSLWNAVLGVCVSGELEGTRLKRIPATPWLTERWKGFFPKGRVVELP